MTTPIEIYLSISTFTTEEYMSLTKKELLNLCKDLKIDVSSELKKSEIVQKIKVKEQEINYDLIYRRNIEEQERIKQEKILRGEQVEPIPLIRVDNSSFSEVWGLILTKFVKEGVAKYAINVNYHCSCFDTQYDEIEEHIYSLDEIINIAETFIFDLPNFESKFNDLFTSFESKSLNIEATKFFQLILDNKDKLYETDTIVYNEISDETLALFAFENTADQYL